MVTLFGTHGVKDFDAWYEGYKAGTDEIAAMGVVSESVYKLADGNGVFVMHTFNDLETAQKFLTMFDGDDAKEQMVAMGIVEPVQFWIAEEV